MSRNGSGGYNLLVNSWNPAVNGVSATPTDWQALINDVAAALQQSISADGQTPITGNLSMNNNKLTGLAAGAATGQSLRWEQLFSQGVEQTLASAATTDIGQQNSNFLQITGTTTITSFGTNYNGPRFIRFAGALTLTNSATLILPNGIDILTTAGDCLIAIPKATSGTSDGWKVIAYQYTSSAATRQSLGFSNIGYRNRVINGGFTYDQRFNNVSQTITAGAALKYVADRFFVYCINGNANAVVPPTVSDGSFKVTGLSVNSIITIGTRLPQIVTKTVSGAATLSVKIISSVGGAAVNWFAYSANTVDTFGTIASPTKTLISSGTFTTTTSAVTYSANFTCDGSSGVEILFTTNSGLSSFEYSNVQLEKGTISNSNIIFDAQDPVIELSRCNRYYRTIKASARGPASAAGQTFDSPLTWNEMRSSPTATIVTAGTTSANASNNGLLAISNIGARLSITSTAAGDCYSVDNVYSLESEMYT